MPVLAFQHPALWRGAHCASPARAGISTGFPPLDAALPSKGWPTGELTELFVPHAGVGEMTLLLPLLAQASRQQGWLAWVDPPHLPCAIALGQAGIAPEQLLWVRSQTAAEQTWALRQILESATCTAVLGWLDHSERSTLRRLQLAAQQGQAPLILFRHDTYAAHPSPAVLKLRLSPGVLPDRLQIDILKRRGPPLPGPLQIALDRPAQCATPQPSGTQSGLDTAPMPQYRARVPTWT